MQVCFLLFKQLHMYYNYTNNYFQCTSTFLFIPAVIINVIHNQAVTFINFAGQDVGISAHANNGLLALIWSAYAIVNLSAILWWICGALPDM
jgi:hypothetical protein